MRLLVNFEFPESRMSEVLSFLGKYGLIQGRLHFYATTEPSGSRDVGRQVRAAASVVVRPNKALMWNEFCIEFGQDCVAFMWEHVKETGWLQGPRSDLWAPFNPEYFVLP